MIPAYKRKSNIGALVFAAGMVVCIWWAAQYPGANIWQSDLLAAAVGVTMVGAYFYALYALVRAKGRNPAWILMTFLNVFGLLVILLLKDHAKGGQAPGEPQVAPNASRGGSSNPVRN